MRDFYNDETRDELNCLGCDHVELLNECDKLRDINCELLEALEFFLSDCIDLDATILLPSKTAIRNARAAIAKAKGE